MADLQTLEGYRECHTCAVRKKLEARQCRSCTGRLDLKDLLLLEGEKRRREKASVYLSALLPGAGHLYSGRPFVGALFLPLAPLTLGLIWKGQGSWNWGMTVLLLALLLVWVLVVLDCRRGSDPFRPPCQAACPAGIPCSQYVHLLDRGKDRESLELIEAFCPFPGTIGRVCHHPCEQECNRGKDGEPVAICSLKRFASDKRAGSESIFSREVAKAAGSPDRKVAIVGAGPSGLSAALYLRLCGFDVSIFEARDVAGGTPLFYAPSYRLPVEVYQREVGRVLALGMDMRPGKKLGVDFSLRDLQAEGFLGVYLAIGAGVSVRLPHTGSESEGFLDGREFLERVRKDPGSRIPGDVLVIGGGNVALDVARSALRCGADKVMVICLEKLPKKREKQFFHHQGEWREIRPKDVRQFMPAHPWGIADAVAEGVEIMDSSAAVEFFIEGGRVKGAKCLRVERIDQDPKGKLVPVFREGTEFNLKADTVLTAVGSFPDFSFLGGVVPVGSPVSRKAPILRYGGIEGVSIPVVAGGDMALGPASVIEAIAAGKEAALYFYRARGGAAPVSVRYRSRRIPEPWSNYRDDPQARRRRPERTLSPEDRARSFAEVSAGLSERPAREEAARCLRCDWPLMRESKVRKFFRNTE